MKKNILILFIGMFFVASFAQAEQSAIKPEGLFSIKNTLWAISNSVAGDGAEYFLGFAGSSIWYCNTEAECDNIPGSIIVDLGFISFFQGGDVGININGFAIPLLGVGGFKMWYGSSSAFSLIFKSADPWYLE